MIATRKVAQASTEIVVLREDGPKPLRPFHNVRGLISTHVQLDGEEIAIINTHLTYTRFHTRDMRRREFTSLKNYLTAESTKHPVFLCGDFNFFGKDARREYLTTHYRAFTGKEVKTWHHRHSPIRANLDYLFWEDEKLAVKARVGELYVSDHRPLIAEISRA